MCNETITSFGTMCPEMCCNSFEECREAGPYVRLVDGQGPWEGRLEVRASSTVTQQWRPVCSYGWTYELANLACLELGFSGVLNKDKTKLVNEIETRYLTV